MPSIGCSAKLCGPMEAMSPGRWLRIMKSTVAGDSSRTPFRRRPAAAFRQTAYSRRWCRPIRRRRKSKLCGRRAVWPVSTQRSGRRLGLGPQIHSGRLPAACRARQTGRRCHRAPETRSPSCPAAQICRRAKRSSGWPVTTSITRPKNVDVATEYSQRVPGLKASGNAARRTASSASVVRLIRS